MIFNVNIQLDFYQQIVEYIAQQTREKNLCEFFIVVPDYNFGYNLKKSFKHTMVLPRIVTLDEVIEKSAILRNKFQYVKFNTKSIIRIYKLLSGNQNFFSINASNTIFQSIKSNKLLDNNYFEYIKHNFFDYKDYLEFQKQSINDIFLTEKKVIIAGFNLYDEVIEYLFKKAIESNQTIFIHGLYTDEKFDENHFLYKLQDFFYNKSIENISNNQELLKINEIFFTTKFHHEAINVQIKKCKNDYEQLIEIEKTIIANYPNVVLVIKNDNLLQKVEHKLKSHNISLIYRKTFCNHLDSLFLFHILDLYLYPDSGRFLLQLMKYTYIYDENKYVVDNIEKNYIRTIRFKQRIDEAINDPEEKLLILKIDKSLKLFDNTTNFAQAHLEIIENLTNRFTHEGKKILEFISKNIEDIKDLQEYKEILTFFINNHYFYSENTFQNKINVLSPEDASFICEENVVVADCTEENFSFNNKKIMYNLFQVVNNKNVFFIYNQQECLSKIVLKMQNIIQDNAPVHIENHFKPTNQEINKDFKIPTKFLPKTLTATMIEFLINDPYEFYLRYILKIKEINPIDAKPSYLEFGNLVHSALQQCNNTEISINLLKEKFNILAKQYYENFIYVKTLWLPRFLKMAEYFVSFHNERIKNIDHIENEMEYSIDINDIKIKARFDRIEYLKDGSVSIIDFKTGTLPSVKDVENFVKPQLLIQALILKEVKVIEISELMYYKLDIKKTSTRRIKNLDELLPKFKDKLVNIINDYKNCLTCTNQNLS
jgi:ATP-dependent helicase/nuclease subunit B